MYWYTVFASIRPRASFTAQIGSNTGYGGGFRILAAASDNQAAATAMRAAENRGRILKNCLHYSICAQSPQNTVYKYAVFVVVAYWRIQPEEPKEPGNTSLASCRSVNQLHLAIMALRMLGSRLTGLLQPARQQFAADLPRLVRLHAVFVLLHMHADHEGAHRLPNPCSWWPREPLRPRHSQRSSQRAKRPRRSRAGGRPQSWTS